MEDPHRTGTELTDEIVALRRRVAELEASAADLQRADQTIRESEQRFRRMVENAWEVVFLHDEQGRITYATESVSRVLGYSVAEYVGCNVFDIIHPDDRALVQLHMDQVLADPGRVESAELRLRHKDGSWRWVEAVGQNLLNDPSIRGFVVNIRDVSERRRVLDALRRSEERLRTVVAGAPVVLFALDASGAFTLSEGRGLEVLGLKPGAVVGQSVFDVYRSIPPIVEQARRALRGESFDAMVEMEGLVWEVRWVSVRDRRGKVDRVIGVATDVSLRRRVEDELRLERASLNELFESSPEAIVLTDNEGLVLSVNQEFTRLFGYSSDDALGRSIDELVAPEDLRAEARSFTERVESGSRVAVETLRKTKDGRLVDVSVLGAPVHVEGSQVAVYAIYRDITERKRGERALQQSEANYRGVVEHATYGVFRSTLDGRFLMVNPALVRMLGYDSADELMRVNIPEQIYVRADDRSRALERGIRDFDRSGSFGVEVEWRRKDARHLTVRLSGRPIYDDDGGIRYLEMIAEDVTSQRMLEAQLRQVQKMEALGQLTGGIAHDFNNLLTVISANAELMADVLPRELSELRADLEDIRTAARSGTALVKKLLGFSRRAMLDPKPMDLSIAVTEAASMLRRIVPENIEIKLSADRPVDTVRADPVALEQILLNLATNARDAMSGGGVLQIDVTETWLDEDYCTTHPWCRPGRYVSIAVADTGVGMSYETKEHLFEPFFTKKPPGVGTGLGMSMVYGLVKQMDGYVDVHSEPEQGTLVKLYFPVLGSDTSATVATVVPTARLAGSETILVVEDEATIRRSITRALEGQGYTVVSAGDGEEALKLFRAHEPQIDLVLSDLVMPKLSGHELLAKLRSEGKRVRFLFTSGYSKQEVQQRSPQHADAPLLHKPWTLSDLFMSVREVLDDHSTIQ